MSETPVLDALNQATRDARRYGNAIGAETLRVIMLDKINKYKRPSAQLLELKAYLDTLDATKVVQ